MGRPPNNAPTNSPTRPWAPPVYLAGGLLRGTVAPHSNKVRQFVLPIPPVPPETSHAIRTSLKASSIHQPFAAQQNRIRTLTTKYSDQRAKAALNQKRLTELEDLKEQGLRDIRETRQQETSDIIATIERKLRTRFNKEAALSYAAFKEKLDLECEAKRKAWKLEQEKESELLAQHDVDATTSSSLADQEIPAKRMKLNNNDDDDKNVEADQQVSNNEKSLDITNVTEKEINLSTQSENIENHPEEGEEQQQQQVKMEATTNDSQNDKEMTLKSDILQQEMIESETALEKLTETRTEMIWLLKQVIKADEKRKLDIIKKRTT